MTDYELKMMNILSDLKANHSLTALKSEFETEGATYEETKYLAKFAKILGLDLVIKIGGCAAVSDIKFAKELQADTIVAPMIESVYAMQKFIESVNIVYENDRKPNLYINIETYMGVSCLPNIIDSFSYNDISGVVFGRSDFVKSCGKDESAIDSPDTLITAKYVSDKILSSEKSFIVGGRISAASSAFLHSVNLSGFETRKIVFDKAELKNTSGLGIIKALDFEILWYKNKCSLFGNISYSDNQRLEVLQKRYNEYSLSNL